MSVRTVKWVSRSGHEVRLATATNRRYALFLLRTVRVPHETIPDHTVGRLDESESRAAVLRRSDDVSKLLKESRKWFGAVVVDLVEGRVVHVQGADYL